MPLPPSPSPHLTTHDISSSTSFRPLHTLPDFILVSIIAHHPLAMHITPHILPPSPTLTSTLEPSTHPPPPHLLTISILTKSRPPFPHTCVANPYGLGPSCEESCPSATITITSIAHRPATLSCLPAPPHTHQLPPHTRRPRASFGQTRPLLIAYSIGSTRGIP